MFLDIAFIEHRDLLLGQFVAGFDIDFARRLINEVGGEIFADQLIVCEQNFLQPVFRQLARDAAIDLFALFQHFFAGFSVDQIIGELGALPAVGHIFRSPATGFLMLIGKRIIESAENFFRRHAERAQERRDRQFTAAIDAHIDDVLGVEFEIEPGAAIRNHAR